MHNFVFDENLNNQSVNYEYSVNGDDWITIANPIEKELKEFYLKATLFSDGMDTARINNVYVNYSICVSECFPSNINIQRDAVVSLMPNEAVFVNASFTGLTINPGALELNKSLSVYEQLETNKSYEKIPAGRFVDIESDILNASFTLRMSYTEEDLASGNIIEESLKIYYWNESGKWDALNSTIYANENYVEAALEHLSTYGLFGEGVDSGSGGGSDTGSGGSSGGSGGRGSSRRVFQETTSTSLTISSTSTTSTSTSSTTLNAKALASQENVATTTLLPLETIQDSASGGLFKAMTGGVVDFGRRIVKTPNLILAGLIIVLAIIYLSIRFRGFKKKKMTKVKEQ